MKLTHTESHKASTVPHAEGEQAVMQEKGVIQSSYVGHRNLVCACIEANNKFNVFNTSFKIRPL